MCSSAVSIACMEVCEMFVFRYWCEYSSLKRLLFSWFFSLLHTVHRNAFLFHNPLTVSYGLHMYSNNGLGASVKKKMLTYKVAFRFRSRGSSGQREFCAAEESCVQ